MLVTRSPIDNAFKPLQPENAFTPISFTLSGIVNDAKALQPENAFVPMLSTPSQIVTAEIV